MSDSQHWRVWHEGFVNFRSVDRDGEEDGASYMTITIEHEGSYAECRKYYRQHGGAQAGLHLGHILDTEE